MKELQMICSTVEKWQGEHQKVAMATVVAVTGSAYRRPGARMIISENGSTFGMIGGGCFDADVREIALEVISTGVPKLCLYNMSDDEVWGLGLGCNGNVYVWIESLAVDSGRELLQKVGESLESRNGLRIEHKFSVPLDFDFRKAIDKVTVVRVCEQFRSKPDQPAGNGSLDSFDEWIEPTPRLFIFGAGHDAIPVVEFAAQAGFEVMVVDQRKEFLSHDRFRSAAGFIHAYPEDYEEKLPSLSGDYVLFMTHRIENDAAAFRACCKYQVKYFGFLGPKRRAEKILKDMVKIESTFLNRIQDRIYSPIGIDLGAETAEQIALSVVTELLAIKNNRIPKFLREKKGNIHDDTTSISPLSLGGSKNEVEFKRSIACGIAY